MELETVKQEPFSLYSPPKEEKKRRFRLYTKKWSIKEEITILQYLLRTVQENMEIEKPSAASYYAKLLEQIPLKNVSVSQLKAKVSNLRKLYINAIQRMNNTETNQEPGSSMNENIRRYCPHFDILDAIYGNNTSDIDISYAYDESLGDHTNSPLDEDYGFFSGNTADIEMENENVPQRAFSEEPSEESEMQFENNANDKRTPKFKDVLEATPVPRKKKKKNSSDLISEFQKKRVEVLSEKNEIEKLKFERELKIKEEELGLERAKFEFEKSLRLKKEENNKLKLEIEKQKIENNFKIEIQKLEIERAKIKINK